LKQVPRARSTQGAMPSPRPSAPRLILILLVAMFAGCSRPTPVTRVTPLKASNPAELQNQLLSGKPDLALFRDRGPFLVRPLKDVEIKSSDLGVSADVYVCAAAEKAPLVIVLHGFGNSKDDHVFQALHVATWGMHAIAIDLPNKGPWIGHGRTLARLVAAIRREPRLVDSHIDPQQIILVGHSFGATAVAAALAEGAIVSGAILLDPAGIGRQLPALLRKVNVPVMLIGADEEIWPTRNREYFYRFVPRGIAEISIRDAVHEDAQYPTEHSVRPPDVGPIATEESQITFVSALAASAFSLTATGGFDYAWKSFEDAVADGRFFNARRK
jgi:pimeloyl-ACP methyl ester carboxylesterase